MSYQFYIKRKDYFFVYKMPKTLWARKLYKWWCDKN